METLKIVPPERDSAITSLAFDLGRRQEVTLGKHELPAEEFDRSPAAFGCSGFCHPRCVAGFQAGTTR
jgi:hypothetical protein